MSITLIALLVTGGGDHKETRDYYESLSHDDISRAPVIFDADIYIQKLYDLDLQSKTFAADGYVWITWNKDLSAWDKKTREDPADTIEFINAVYKDDFSESLSPEDPYFNNLKTGYQSKVFSGRFLADAIDLHRFPFETIMLPIEVETDDFWISEAVIRATQTDDSGVSAKNSLNGYSYQGMRFVTRKHIYNTGFGLGNDALSAFGDKNRTEYSNCVAELIYRRNPGSTAWRLFVPLLAVLWIAILSPLIDPRNLEPKIALPASVVLSLVFLQQGYREMLPDSIAYLTFMDKVYGLAYFVTFLVFLEAVVSTNLVLRLDENLWKRVSVKIKKRERGLHRFLVGLLVVCPIILWYTS